MGIGIISAAEAGISRTLFYRWQARFERYVPDGLHPAAATRDPAGRRRSPRTERLVLGLALAWPTWGCGLTVQPVGPRDAGDAGAELGADCAPARGPRAAARPAWAARAPQRGHLRAADRAHAPAIGTRPQPRASRQAEQPGDLVSIDTFLYRQTERDRQGLADHGLPCRLFLRGGLAPAGVHGRGRRHFLREILVLRYWRAGWPLQRVLTDRGSEFKSAFDHACQALGIGHTRTQPRHAWTNGFVERLQGARSCTSSGASTIRRQYFISPAAMQRTLEVFMKFNNEQRPRQGYRLRGRTPADLFWGAAPVAS
jgi:hypothetical protein